MSKSDQISKTRDPHSKKRITDQSLFYQMLTKFLKNSSIKECSLGKTKFFTTVNLGLEKNIQQYTDQLDEGNLSCGVFTDLQKAFDTVNHKILLKKLESYGFRGVANEWFSTYLSNRKQYVHIPGEESSYRKIKHGVPQGSVLGPILFLL